MSADAILAPGVTPPSEREFALFQRLIHEEAGIHLGPAKKELLVARLRRRMLELGVSSFRDYYQRVTSDRAERVELLDRISTNETRFFREAAQMAFLVERVLPRLREEGRRGRRPQRLRAWSAGCSTGEEAYTLAMLLHRHLPAYDGWEIEIVATDLSTRALQRAQEGRYGIDSAEHIPEAYRKTFMLKGVRSRARWMTVGPLARSGVRFSRLNLWTDPYPATAFDLILCRNVLIYFDVAAREEVLSRLVRRLAPDGLLLLGHAEALTGRKHGLHGVGPLTYAPARERVS